MNKARVEAYTDAIVAIVMTIMALEIKVPTGVSWQSLLAEGPYFAAFIVSFAVIAGSWYHHHYLFTRAKWISKRAFWVNNLWLLLMAFFPVATGWVSEHINARVPEYFYFFVYLAWAAAYYLLSHVLVNDNPKIVFGMRGAGRVRPAVIDLSASIIGLVTTYFWPVCGIVIVLIQSMIWAVLTPADSDRVAVH